MNDIQIKNTAYIKNLEFTEYLFFVLVVLFIFLISWLIQKRNIKSNPLYRFYTKAVMVKIFGAFAFCMVYIFYYHGGDTISYFETSRALTNLMIQRPSDFFTVITHKASIANYYLFDGVKTGFPWPYMYFDPKTFFVAKLLVPFMFVSFQSYLLTSVIFAWISFVGIWKMFLMFGKLYKNISFQLAIAILFIPSVIFWGSGILKDTVTLSASCWFIYALYNSLIIKKKPIKHFIILFISGYIIYSIKPYILFALLPGAFILVIYDRISRIKSKLFRYAVIPLIYIASFGGGYGILTFLSGSFNVSKLLSEASVKQNDLQNADYDGHSFNIGSYNPTISGTLKAAPAALIAGLYRPFIWESKTVMMLLSGIENLIYLSLTIWILLKVNFIRLMRIIFENPLVLFCLSYSFFFAMIVGLSTSNFGALVRFKIAYAPEFLCALVILNYYRKIPRKR
ncbi:MAG TPA: hypothetical protein VNG53_07925 [Bacteroidia bacterium]|nr:hypothetical protein [Bacteroidia bacterium]